MLILTFNYETFEVTTSENFSWIFTKDEANGETLTKMNGDVDVSSAYNEQSIKKYKYISKIMMVAALHI